jgi:heme/copper-type cytochrome/quinol oxidase subunit 4
MTDTTHTSERISPRAMTVVWLALVVITVGSWWLAPAHITGTVHENTPITALVLLLAAVKSRLIIRYFMEVRTAPRWLRRATDAWLAVLVTAVFVLHLI